MSGEVRFRHVLSKRDCSELLELIHFCALARGHEDDIHTLFVRLDRLIPMDAAVIASGRVDRRRLGVVDRLFSHGPNAWMNPYRKMEMERVDPIIQRALSDGTPFRWSEAKASHPSANRDYQELKRDIERSDGMAAACRGRRNRGSISLLSVAVPERCIDKRHLIIAGYVLPHIHEVLAHEDLPRIELTPREAEIMRWVSAGKSNWEIGEILALSERTVKFHLSNVFTKLEASSRSQALAKAIRHGLVAP